MNRKWTTLGTLVGAAAVGAAGSVYYWLLQRPLPQTSGELKAAGLQGRVEIIRDR